MNTNGSVNISDVNIDKTGLNAVTNQAYANSLWQKLFYNNQYFIYVNNFYQTRSSILNLILALLTIAVVSIFLFSIVIALSLIPVYINSATPISGLVLTGAGSPIKTIALSKEYLSSISYDGLTIWNSSSPKNFTTIYDRELEHVDHLNSTTLITLSKAGNLSYWKSSGILSLSISIPRNRYTIMTSTKSGQVIIGSHNGTYVVLGQKIVKNLKSDSPIVDTAVLSDDSLVTVDTSNQLKIYNSKNYQIVKKFNLSGIHGHIAMVSGSYVKNFEHILYTIDSKSYQYFFDN